ncbi:hypothetical protein PSAL_003540 [Pseudooceanicola algae]|uniref:DUF927 domain-containing protein n=1 Tax=Pseudooceanicola algae TaxID=1537215 RepID=A0A418SKB6_9RHOB|nr:hypothetical protein PSAL_003540 [Pseudooceanicola algae]
MTTEPGDMSWLEEPARTTYRPDARPSEADLRAGLAEAPEAPGRAFEESTGHGEHRDAGKSQGAAGEDRGSSAAGDGAGGGGSGRPRGEIWEDCPVVPLGVHGDLSYYLDTKGQLRSVDNHSLDKIRHIFGGRIGLLSAKYPSYYKNGDPKPGAFDQAKAATAMVAASTERGVWSPVGKVRGAGAWLDEDGRLIFHAGDEVMIEGRWRSPGVYGGHVYPASDPVPRPAKEISAEAAAEILTTLESWNWARPDIDPMLTLGVICAQQIGGALDWRPVTWVTGDQATGKSTLQRLLRYLHGGSSGLLQASDATEAGIRSVIGYSSMPVALDELEPDDDPKKGKAGAIIRLARIAASGDQILRGSTDQKGYQGNAYSCFLFSSILVPPLPPQDRSRLILLDLNRLSPDAPKPKDDPRRLKALGATLRASIIGRWDSWAERLDLWRGSLAAQGHGGRQADNYGTVLALADMALHEALPPDELMSSWARKLDVHLSAESVDVGSNAEDMLVHLLSQPLDVWRRGQKLNVASWIAMAAKLPRAPEAIEAATAENANTYLAQFGLRVKGRDVNAELCIANKPLAGLRSLFEGTPWAEGVWSQAARRVTDAKSANMTFARVPSRGYAIPFTSIPGLLNAMDETGGVSQRREASVPPDMEDFV